jgi:hypothetical protein
MASPFTIRSRRRETVGHRLDAAKIIETAKNLSDGINERLSGSRLAGLAKELAEIAVAADERSQAARRPIIAIRVVSAAAISLCFLGLWYLGHHIKSKWEFGTITELFEALHTGFNLVVLLIGALWFCITLEARIKRKQMLVFIEELREFIHVIDITQLYYTPDLYGSRSGSPLANLPIDESYLLFSTQMLALISNLAPLYARGSTGDSILRAASEVEMLAIAVTNKHRAKAEVVRLLGRQSPHVP